MEPPDSEKTRVEKQLDYQMEAYLPSNTKNKKVSVRALVSDRTLGSDRQNFSYWPFS